MADAPQPAVWPILYYHDTAAALRFLVEAFGFREALWCPAPRESPCTRSDMRAGVAASYVVAEDVDAVHRRAVRAGAEIVEGPHEAEFGSGEGNLWTFGSYRGAP